MLKKRRKIFLFSVMLFFSIILCYGVGELVVYSLYKNRIVLFPRYVTGVTYNDFNIRGNVPHSRYVHKSREGRWEFRINGQGFRNDVEFEYENPKNTFRILVVGDSFTIGYEVGQNETYAAITQKYLKQKGIEVEVINAGVSGFGNAEELVFFEQEGLKYKPDVLILGFYENDFDDNMRSNLYKVANNELVVNAKTYQPAIKIRDFLNSFFVYRWLSEHSYLHNYLNTVATVYFKNRKMQKNEETMAVSKNSSNGSLGQHKNNLTLKLFKRIYEVAQKNNIFFVILDIPNEKLISSFPSKNYSEFSDYFFDASKYLYNYGGLTDLYRQHGHDHWTPISHLVVGKAIAEFIENNFIPKDQIKAYSY